MTPRMGLAAAALLLLALACDRKIEPFVPGEKPEAPDLSRIFPEGAEKAAKQEAKPGMPAAPASDRGTSTASPITGTVSIKPELASRVPPGAVLFLIARTSEKGPPLAVKRIPDPKLPLDFSIGPDDRMIQALPFAGPIQLSARIDSDGNAMTKLPGDLAGAASLPHEPGDHGVSVVIDQVL